MKQFNIYATARVRVKAVILANDELEAAKIFQTYANLHVLDEKEHYAGLQRYYHRNSGEYGYLDFAEYEELEDAYRVESVDSIRTGSDIHLCKFSHSNLEFMELKEFEQ